MVLCRPAISLAQGNADFDRALAEFRSGNYAAASTLFAKAEAASPGTTDALLYEARAQIHWNDFAGAEKSLRGYISAHPGSADALYLLGFVLHRENRPAESLDTYTRAAAIMRPTGDDLKIVGLDYVLLDDYPDAIKWLEKAVGFDPKNEDAWYYLGRACYTKGNLDEAQKAFHAVLNLQPHDVRAENNLGLIFETEGNPAAAIEAYRTAIAWQAQDLRPSEQPYVNLGSLLMEQEQAGTPNKELDPLDPLKKAVEIAPTNAYCRMKLGIYYRKAGQLAPAQQELEKATQLEPENATAHYQLGRLYKDMNQLDRAKAEFDRTAELQSRAARRRVAP